MAGQNREDFPVFAQNEYMLLFAFQMIAPECHDPLESAGYVEVQNVAVRRANDFVPCGLQRCALVVLSKHTHCGGCRETFHRGTRRLADWAEAAMESAAGNACWMSSKNRFTSPQKRTTSSPDRF